MEFPINVFRTTSTYSRNLDDDRSINVDYEQVNIGVGPFNFRLSLDVAEDLTTMLRHYLTNTLSMGGGPQADSFTRISDQSQLGNRIMELRQKDPASGHYLPPEVTIICGHNTVSCRVSGSQAKQILDGLEQVLAME